MLLSSVCFAAWGAAPRAFLACFALSTDGNRCILQAVLNVSCLLKPSLLQCRRQLEPQLFPHAQRGGQYLTFNACQAAAAGLWVADLPAVAAAVLPGQADVVQLPLLLLVDLLHPHGFQQRTSLLGRVGLEEEAVLQVHIADVDVIVRDVFNSELVGLL